MEDLFLNFCKCNRNQNAIHCNLKAYEIGIKKNTLIYGKKTKIKGSFKVIFVKKHLGIV